MANDAQIPQDAREALAMQEVGHTDVSRGGIAVLLVVFALIVLLVPAVQLVSEWRRGETVSEWGLKLPKSIAALHLAPSNSELADAVRADSPRKFLRSLRA